MLGILIHQTGLGLKRLMRHSSSPVFMRSGDRPALADIRCGIGHGLTPHAGNVSGDLRRRVHEEVTQGTGDLDVFCAQSNANPLLGVVVLVDRVVAPVCAVAVGRRATHLADSAAVPDVVIGVRFFIFHAPTSSQRVRHRLTYARFSS
jgi:hypothetical protein